MKVALVGAELEENLGLRYIASSLEKDNHEVKIIPFNNYYDLNNTIEQVINFSPKIAGLSMVFTSRAKEFCKLSEKLRNSGFKGHIIAGGPFASFNNEQLLKDFSSFDSIALTEGEKIMCELTKNLDNLSKVPAICYRNTDGLITKTSCIINNDDIDSLPFPRRTSFHKYFGLSIASILTSRGCWRNCLFCSINAWYRQSGKKTFRLRSIDNIVEEMKLLYFTHNVRIFNFQDDNFFLASAPKTLERFKELRFKLKKEGIKNIAIAVKARPDSISEESIAILNELGLFRIFLGVENASENGLKNLNRKCNLEQILNALNVLNKYDIHVAYNLLLFEPDTTMEDISINLRFLEEHIDNPQNFCRAEVHAGTGLESKLIAEGKLQGDYFGLDYRITDPQVEIFHQITHYAFFDRNFNNSGLHYFNMQVDFYYQLLRRFFPEVLDRTIRSYVRNFIKRTNMATYHLLSNIYDFVNTFNTLNEKNLNDFASKMRYKVDKNSMELRVMGESIIGMLDLAYKKRGKKEIKHVLNYYDEPVDFPSIPFSAKNNEREESTEQEVIGLKDILNLAVPIPYITFKKMIQENQ
jgi:methylmalonyl-CoA mutase cobalamin-binding subunit